jgi:hypothetical protein
MQIGFINKLTLLSLLPVLVTIAHADTTTDSRWGFEVQVYPTGIIPGIRYEWELSTQDQLFARVAYHIERTLTVNGTMALVSISGISKSTGRKTARQKVTAKQMLS